MVEEKPERQFVMMIGLMGARKTTYIKEHEEDFKEYTILSFDNLLKKMAKTQHKDINKPDRDLYDDAIAEFTKQLEQTVEDGKNILIDRSSATEEARTKLISIAKSSEKYNYQTTAIIIHPPREEERLYGLLKRAREDGYTLPFRCSKYKKLELPVKGDGEFDKILEVHPKNPQLKRLPWLDMVETTENKCAKR